MADHPIHKAAELFPLMDGEAFEGLVSDIATNGLREPIVLYKGEILDGRNRYRACKQLGIEPRTMNWHGEGSPTAYVISKNLHRRHLNETQRAMIAARIAPGTMKTSLKNLKQNQGDSSDAQIWTSEEESADTMTVAQAADALNIGSGTVSDAKKVLREGTQEEVALADQGKVAVTTLADDIRERSSDTVRKKKRCRSQEAHIRAKIWKELRTALTSLGGLPSPADVAAIASEGNKGAMTDKLLDNAVEWLKEFENEWRKRRENA